eukprot:jgi/Botrbrau1/15384/Bobra.43_2s0013.1
MAWSGLAEGSTKMATDPLLIGMAHEMNLDGADRLRAGFANMSDAIQDVHLSNWNLDRIDQRSLPLDGFYKCEQLATSVRALVNCRMCEGDAHVPISSQTALRLKTVMVTVPHVASTAIGRTVGVAKGARGCSCQDPGLAGLSRPSYKEDTFFLSQCHLFMEVEHRSVLHLLIRDGKVSDTVAALDWVARNVSGPSIVTMSLGITQGQSSKALADAVRGLILLHNVTAVVASGNSGMDSCLVVPANVEEAITVAASDLDSKFNSSQPAGLEDIYRYANTGSCVDIFAPGVDILAACGSTNRCENLDDRSYAWASGTSMAVPHVAGVAALYLAENPTATPAQVKLAILNAATPGVLNPQRLRSGTPNRLLYSAVTRADASRVEAATGP